jgi:hypothetical protein
LTLSTAKSTPFTAVSVDTGGVAARVAANDDAATTAAAAAVDDVAFFRQFDVVVCVGQSAHVVRRVNAICRTHTPLSATETTTTTATATTAATTAAVAEQNKILFFAVGLFGFYGYCFEDLALYHYYAVKTTWEGGKKVEHG